MKFALVLIVGIVSSLFSFGQSVNDYLELQRSVLSTEKKAAITEVMNLSESESGPFWTLYNEYEAAKYKLENGNYELIMDYAENYSNMTDEKADELMSRFLANEMKIRKLKTQFYKKFKKVLPAGKAARFMQVDNKIDVIIDAELASEIPLIEINR